MKIFDLIRRITEAGRHRGELPTRPIGGRHSADPDKRRVAWAELAEGAETPWGGGLR